MNSVNIGNESLEDGFLAGNGTVGGTETKISSVNFKIRKHVVIRADSGNANTVIVGRPGAASAGFILNAGEQTPPIYVDETDKVAVYGGAADQAYSWIVN